MSSRRDPVDAEKFVRAWMDGKTYAEIAQICGCHPTYVPSFANRLRKKGVALPERRTQLNVAALNAIVKGCS